MATKKLEVVITGDPSGAQRAFGQLESSGSAAWGKLVQVGKWASIAAVAAIGTIAVKGVQAFVDFERSMNEVFTLLPGISQEAMDDMTGQVKDFAVEFGVLPAEVVPALYQALSAGIPQDNVFTFLETAQKAAKGGVTDLTTAVDGISSVINAYGDEVITAAEASDAMFTAVRLGKTTFGEIASSMSAVTPIASAMNVSFGDLMASTALMTSQGIDTSQAMTQQAAAINELSDPTKQAGEAFEKVAGISFMEFMAEGNDLADVMDIVQQAANDADIEIGQLFSRKEAASFARVNDADALRDALKEVDGAAGATDAAFDQMMQGLGPLIDKFKAWVQVMLIEVGEKIVPVIEKVVHWFGEHKEVGIALAAVIGGALLVAIGAYVISMTKAVAVTVAAFAPILAVVAVVAALVAGFMWAYQNVDWFRDAVDAAWQAIQKAATWAWENVIQPVFEALVGYVRDVVIPWWGFLWEAAQEAWDTISTAATWAWENVIQPVFEFIRSFIEDKVLPAWENFRSIVETVWGAVVDAAQWAWEDIIEPVFEFIRSFIEDKLLPAWDDFKVGVETAWNSIVENSEEAWKKLSPILTKLIEKLDEGGVNANNFAFVWNMSWSDISQAISDAWADIEPVLADLIFELSGPVNDAMDGTKIAAELAWDGITETVSVAVETQGRLLSGLGGTLSWLWERHGTFREIAGFAWTTLGGVISDQWNFWFPIFKSIGEWVGDRLVEAFEDFREVADDVWNGITWVIDEAWRQMSDIFGLIGGAITTLARGFEIFGSIVALVFGGMVRAAELAFSGIRSVWNSTIGGKGAFTIPFTDVSFGGIPTLHTGGVYRSPMPGGEGLALLRDREVVVTPEQAAMSYLSGTPSGSTARGGDSYVVVHVDGSVLSSKEELAEAVRSAFVQAQRTRPTPILAGLA